MKQLLLLFVLMLLPLVASADAVEIDGIYYNLVPKAKQAEVTKKPSGYYSGSIVIPTSVTYEDIDYSVTSIGQEAFRKCSLTSVTIPNSVTSIGNFAFYGCSSLTSLIIPNSLTSIGGSAFYYCSGLTSVIIPNSVTSIGNYAFSDCTGLTSVTIPNSVTSIGESTFYNCNGLTSVTIPNSVTRIGESAFMNCSSLASISIPNSVTSIGNYAFCGCSSLTSVTIPNSVTSIGQSTFYNCNGLTSVTIPNRVWRIENSTFYNCSGLTSMTIGSGVNYINYLAFAKCANLETVTCLAENVPSTDANAFQDSYVNYSTLYVPAGSINAYKTTAPWSEFGTFKPLDGGDVEIQKCATPTISYSNGKLTFGCETEGVEFVSDITDSDIKKNYSSEVFLSVTYTVKVYAVKSGYQDSDVATATLCWIDKEPTTEGITNGVSQIPAKAVLIQSDGGILKVEGVDDGTQVSVFTPDGKQVGSAFSHNGTALVGTSIQPGNTAIVKIGNKSVKVVVK